MSKKILYGFLTALTALLYVPRIAAAQESDSLLTRQSVLAEARQLKNLYKTDEALALLVPLLRPDTVDEEVMAEMADCHYQNGNWQAAAMFYMMLSQAEPDKPVYKIRRMLLAYRMKDYGKTTEIGKDILRQDTIPALVSLVGDAYNQTALYDSALVYYHLSLKIKPLNESVVSKTAKIYLNRKDYDRVLAVTDSFLVHDSDNFVVAPIKGLALYRKEDYDAAVDVFERQRQLGNDDYAIHFYLGQSYWQTNTMYRAEEELETAWQIDSTDVGLALSLAAVKADAHRPFEKEIRPWLDRAMDMLQPDSRALARLHRQYGIGYYRLNDWPRAIEHYKAAYEYSPDQISDLSTVAYCYEQMKQYKVALEWYEKYLRRAKPGTRGYEFAQQSIAFLKGELFMEEE